MKKGGLLPILKSAIIGLCGLFTLATASQTPSGDLRESSFADLKDHPIDSKTYNEFWTYQFFLDGGTQIILNYSRANLGSFKDPVCGADVSFIDFKGKNYSVAREYPKKNFKWNSANQGLNVHKDIWFKGPLPQSHEVYFSTRKNKTNYYIHLSFSEIDPGYVWGDGQFSLGSEKVGIYIHIPRAVVKGKIAINKDTLDVTGIAYMDHTFQSTMGTDLVDEGYRFYSPGENPIIGNFVKPLSKYKMGFVGYGLQKTESGYQLLQPGSLNISEHKKMRDIKLPQALSLTGPKGNIVLKVSKHQQQLSILDGFDSWFEKKAVKLFLGGEMIHFRGLAKVNGSPGYFNFFGLE